MKSRLFSCLLGASALVALSACHRGGEAGGGGGAPGGQVVASFGNEEVTTRELNAEMSGFSSDDPKVRKAAENAALAAIINRKLAADAARKAGLDKSPEYQLAKQRNDELLLAQMTQRQVASKVAQPTTEEAQAYINQHPNNFAQRKLITVDQIQVSRGIDPNLFKALTALNSNDEIEQRLLSAGVDYRRVPNTFDGRQLPPKVIDQIVNVKPGEVYVLPVGNQILINQTKEVKIVPFTGDQAIAAAQQQIFQDRVKKALAARGEEIRKAGGEIKYKDGYGPPATAKPQAGKP